MVGRCRTSHKVSISQDTVSTATEAIAARCNPKPESKPESGEDLVRRPADPRPRLAALLESRRPSNEDLMNELKETRRERTQ